MSAVRHFHLSASRREQASSKVEETVKAIQERKADPNAAAVAAANGTDSAVAKPVVKKSLGTRVWDEVLHYYHGFRLLFLDINVARKLLWKTIRGTTLTRREYMLLIRTTGDVFRLVPFSVFIIIPFMELLLPVFIKFFPGMLPSTFQTARDVEDKARQNLKVKLEMAKFLQKTLDEMDVHNSNHSSEEAREFIEFFKKLRTTGEHATPEEIMRFSKLFEDEITLDSLSLPQLAAICRVLEVPTYGTSAMLRYQLRMKLRSLAADDRMIQKEGVDTLSLVELQAASRARGMRSYGLTLGKLREQISEWIHLSLNEKVPPSLLLLSRAMMLPEDVTTSEKLKASMTVLSESAAIQTQAAIGEREGKIDNRTKIEIIRDEQRKIKEELEEQKQVDKADEELVDQAKVLAIAATAAQVELGAASATTATTAGVSSGTVAQTLSKDGATEVVQMSAKEVSDVVTEAIGAIGAEKKTLLVEKEEIKDLKEEIAEYKEDVEELNMVRKDIIFTGIPFANVVSRVQRPQISKTVEKPTIKESNASKNLLKKVDSMISKLDQVLANLDAKEAKLKATLAENQDAPTEELVRIDEIIGAIRKVSKLIISVICVAIKCLLHTVCCVCLCVCVQMQKVPDESKLEQIEKILGRIDDDQDGNLKVDDVVRIIQEIGKESVSLNEKQVEELMQLITKEEQIENEEKIKKALAKSLEEERLQKVAAKAASDAEQLSDGAHSVSGSKQKSEELTDAGTKVLSDETKKSKVGSDGPKTV